jgi:hypothetical protein
MSKQEWTDDGAPRRCPLCGFDVWGPHACPGDSPQVKAARLQSAAEGLAKALAAKMEEYRPHDPGYCPVCDAARAALRAYEEARR